MPTTDNSCDVCHGTGTVPDQSSRRERLYTIEEEKTWPHGDPPKDAHRRWNSAELRWDFMQIIYTTRQKCAACGGSGEDARVAAMREACASVAVRYGINTIDIMRACAAEEIATAIRALK